MYPGRNVKPTGSSTDSNPLSCTKCQENDNSCNNCRMYDACAEKEVVRYHGRVYVDSCGNVNHFMPDCSVQVNQEAPKGSGCTSTCDRVMRKCQVRDQYKSSRENLEMLPGCNEHLIIVEPPPFEFMNAR